MAETRYAEKRVHPWVLDEAFDKTDAFLVVTGVLCLLVPGTGWLEVTGEGSMT